MSDADPALKRSVQMEAEVSDILHEERRHNLHPRALPPYRNGT